MIWDLLTNPLMWSFLIEACRILLDHSFQMPILVNEYMIQALSSQAAHEPFANSICLGRSIWRLQFFGACCHCRKVRGVFAITIANQILRSFPTGCCFPQLLRRPFIGRVLGNTRVHDPTPFQFHHYKDIPLPEQPIVNYCKVTSPDVSSLVLQEGRPGLTR